jgi:protein-disulfide isomerase
MLAFAAQDLSNTATNKTNNASGESGISRSQAEAILDELKQIRQLLAGQAKPPAAVPAPQKRSVKVQGGHTLGAENAPMTMIEFSDYQCPYCRSFDKGVFDQIRKAYIDTGKLRFVSRNLPLEIHPAAMRSAEAALCAGDQGRFWDMRDFLLRAPDPSEQRILDSAQTMTLDSNLFRACLDGETHKAEILADLGDAAALQINGTPAFVIGKTTATGVDGYVTVGTMPFAQFEAQLKAAAE